MCMATARLPAPEPWAAPKSVTVGAAANELSVINIFGGGSILGPANTAYVLDLATGNSGGALDEMNLGTNGTLAIGGVTAVNAGPIALLNFNGGTLQRDHDNAGFMTSPNIEGVFIYPGGATIDDGGFDIVDSIPLQSPTGYGVSSISLWQWRRGLHRPALGFNHWRHRHGCDRHRSD